MLQRGVGRGPRRVVTRVVMAGCAPPGAWHGSPGVLTVSFPESWCLFTEQPPSQDLAHVGQ